ncbi:MAG: CehA/McbA family metallohydrolase [Myxococcaceae bacterium]
MLVVAVLAAAVVGAYACLTVKKAKGLSADAVPAPSPAIDAGEVRWLKGQTHAHTGNSGDSHTPPLDAARWYARHGFDFVVFTDHNRVTQLPPVDGMLVIPGMEITQNLKTCSPAPPEGMVCLLHVNALFIDPTKLAQMAETESVEREVLYGRAIDVAKQMGALPQVNHPNFMYGADAPLLTRLDARGAHWFEVANTQGDANNEGDASHPTTAQMWNDALDHGARLYGMATDDAHHYDDAEAVRARGEEVFTGDHGFIMVHARKSPSEIKAAVERGDFYSTNGPKLIALEVGDGGITLQTGDEAELRFLRGPGGEVVSSIGTRASFSIGDRAWLRAEAHFKDGGVIWTQPLFAPSRP